MSEKTKKIRIFAITLLIFTFSSLGVRAEIMAEYLPSGVYVEEIDLHAEVDVSEPVKNDVDWSVNYWNEITANTVKKDGKDYTIQYFMSDMGSSTLGASYTGLPYIGYNTKFDYDTSIPGQINTQMFNLSQIAIHEVGHQMGITNGYNNGAVFKVDDKKYADYVLEPLRGQETWQNNIVYEESGVYTPTTGMHTATSDNGATIYGSDTIIGKIQNGTKFYYNGKEANEIYQDKWITGKEYDNKPTIEVETGQTLGSIVVDTEDGEVLSTGSMLVHPYIPFGIMNATCVPDSRTFFSEVELAILKEALENNSEVQGTINLKDFFGHSIYTDNNVVANNDEWSSDKLYAVGLHIVGNENTVTQNANLSSNGIAGAGIRVEGMNNKVINNADISTDGINGMGALVTHGGGSVLNNNGVIKADGADGTAVYLSSGVWWYDNYQPISGSAVLNNTGKLSAKNGNAIVFSSFYSPYVEVTRTFTSTANIMNNSEIIGNILAEDNALGVLNFGLKADASGSATADADPDFKLNYSGDIWGYNDGSYENGAGKITLNNKGGETTFENNIVAVQNLNVDSNTKILGSADIISENTTNNGIIEAKSFYIPKNGSFEGGLTSSTSVTNARIEGSFKENSLNINNGYFKAFANNLGGSEIFAMQNLTLNNAYVSMVNGNINNMAVNNLTSNKSDFIFDVDLAGSKIDTITTNNPVSGVINIVGYNTLSDSSGLTTLRPVLGTDDVTINTIDSVMNKIFKYGVYSSGNSINFNQNGFNPSVLAASVGAQVGTYLTQLNSYEQALGNYDMLMALPQAERQAIKFSNKYAFDQGTGEGGVITFDPNQLPEKDKGLWFRPYAVFESVGLQNGPGVSNTAYGSLFGGDTGIVELSNGWESIYSLYAGYNGSHQTYDGVGIYQNGGQLGASALFYKGKLFTGLTANVGANVGQANTMYGREDFTMLATGIASKTGYNFEFKEGRFIIQPNYLMSYTFVNTFDYRNAAGVSIDSSPLNAIQIAPGLKLIGNLQNGWQPYAAMQMVWNIMDKTKFSANDVSLPEMSIKPYFQYGIGVQKRWGEKFTGFVQAMLRNGGRNGIALQFGFRWTVGK